MLFRTYYHNFKKFPHELNDAPRAVQINYQLKEALFKKLIEIAPSVFNAKIDESAFEQLLARVFKSACEIARQPHQPGWDIFKDKQSMSQLYAQFLQGCLNHFSSHVVQGQINAYLTPPAAMTTTSTGPLTASLAKLSGVFQSAPPGVPPSTTQAFSATHPIPDARPAQLSGTAVNTNVILYKASGGELAVKFPSQEARDHFITELSNTPIASKVNENFAAMIHDDNPDRIYFSAYQAKRGELGVNFVSTEVRDTFVRLLGLGGSNEAETWPQQPFTLYLNERLHQQGANLEASYTAKEPDSRGKRFGF